MARMEYSGFEILDNQLMKLSRETVRRLVEAGANELVQVMQDEIQARHHIATGQMQESVKPGQYHETLDGGWMDVYPQGYDSRGISNAQKAFITNYGRGGRRTAKTGDKWITGSQRKWESAIDAAMNRENEKIINEANGG